MNVTLYGIPGSHPVRAVRLMLDNKGIPYRRVDLLPVVSRVVVPHLLRFPGNRVPAIKIDGRKLQGTREIALELDRVQPDPPLFPSDPDLRDKVEEAERFANGFQQFPRTIIWWATKRASFEDQKSFLADARLGLPPSVLVRTGAPLQWAARKANSSYDDEVQRRLRKLPTELDKIDGWIGEGVLGGDRLYVADFDIGTSLRLLMSMEDLREAIASRPAGELAKRVQPQAPGHIGSVFPAEWLEPLRVPAPA